MRSQSHIAPVVGHEKAKGGGREPRHDSEHIGLCLIVTGQRRIKSKNSKQAFEWGIRSEHSKRIGNRIRRETTDTTLHKERVHVVRPTE